MNEPVIGICYCGRPMANGRHSDSGDPTWCYPEEKGLDDESRCDAMIDPRATADALLGASE